MTDTPQTDELIAVAKTFGDEHAFNSVAEHARTLERQLAAATARLEAAEKDAARYRWLRDNCFDTVEMGDGDSFGNPHLHFEDPGLSSDADSLDAVVDDNIAELDAAQGSKP